MTGPLLFESCVDSKAAALASAEGGAGRLELCARLDVGGTTPDASLVREVVTAVSIPVRVMVRPRGGSFVYDAEEQRAMADAIAAMRDAGAHGIVTGALDADGDVDAGPMRRFIEAAQPLPVTFHRAIDEARDPLASLDVLLDLGVDRILTSGARARATDGAGTIAALVARARGRLTIVAGGGVRAHNVAEVVHASGVHEVHAHLLTRAIADADWATQVRAFVAALQAAARG